MFIDLSSNPAEVYNLCLKKTKINEKEARDDPFKKVNNICININKSFTVMVRAFTRHGSS